MKNLHVLLKHALKYQFSKINSAFTYRERATLVWEQEFLYTGLELASFKSEQLKKKPQNIWYTHTQKS